MICIQKIKNNSKFDMVSWMQKTFSYVSHLLIIYPTILLHLDQIYLAYQVVAGSHST